MYLFLISAYLSALRASALKARKENRSKFAEVREEKFLLTNLIYFYKKAAISRENKYPPPSSHTNKTAAR
jgi:hypothetical protein